MTSVVGRQSKFSVSSLRDLRTCGKLFTLNSMELKGSRDERYVFLQNSIEYMKQLLAKGGCKEKLISRMNDYININYSKDWFFADVAYERNKEKDTKKILRLMNYLLAKDADKIKVNLYYKIDVNLNVNGIEIDSISDHVDLLLMKGDNYEAIKIILREPDSSYRARKDIRKVENNLDLVCMASALGLDYQNLTFSVYSLKNKDDKGDIFPNFENAKGNNIVSTDFSDYKRESGFLDTDKLLVHLLRVVNLKDEPDCRDCWQKGLCKYNPEVRYPYHPENDTEHKRQKVKTFTEKQLQVVKHLNGPMNVIAVPGAGKTGSLVGRLEYLINEAHVYPGNILFLTFTNKACAEIEERVRVLIDDEASLPHIFTFNGFGYRILRDNSSAVGGKVKLADEPDRLGIILQVIRDMPAINGVSYDSVFSRYGLIRKIDKWINEIDEIGAEAFRMKYEAKYDVECIFAMYSEYRHRFEEAGYINYDDQIDLCNKMFKRNPEILKLYQRLFRYIMVDEFQDVSEPQAQLVYSLAAHGNIVVVGDDDQGIYKFRGGSSSYLINFPNVFKGCKTILMEDNFRSNNLILDASKHLIEKNSQRISKEFIPHCTVKHQPILINKGNKDILLKYVLKALEKYEPGDIAIIARTNSTLIALADFLSKYIKVTSPKDYVIEDTVFILYYDLFTLLFNGLDNDCSFYRLAMFGGVENLMVKQDKSKSLYQNLVAAGSILPLDISATDSYRNYFLNRESGSSLMQFGLKLIRSFSMFKYGISDEPERLLNDVLCTWTGLDKPHPVAEILAKAMDERRMESFYELFEYMKKLVLFEDGARVGYEASRDAVNLLTGHDSKGKEFPFVFIYGVDDFTGKNEKELEEERKLLFVSMTRAKSNLVLFGFGTPVDAFCKELSEVVRVI